MTDEVDLSALPEDIQDVAALCKQDIERDIHVCRGTPRFILRLIQALAVALEALQECPHCDGTGVVESIIHMNIGTDLDSDGEPIPVPIEIREPVECECCHGRREALKRIREMADG